MLSYLQEKFRQATRSSYQRKIEDDLGKRYPDAKAVIEALQHPQLEVITKKYSAFAYAGDDNTVTLVTQENSDLQDDADRVYGALLHKLERKGLASEDQVSQRQDLYAHIYQDQNGCRTRFTINDLNRSAPDTNRNILQKSIDFLDKSEIPACAYILKTLQDNHVTINIIPSGGRSMKGGFAPESDELSLYYDPHVPEPEAMASTIFALIHESCHYNQLHSGLLAEGALEADNYREIYHLNELQAHTVQYKVALELLTRQPCFEKFITGEITKNDLAHELQNSDDIDARLCWLALCETNTGQTILQNLETRQKAGLSIPAPFDSEAVAKEALCQGRITTIHDGLVEYDREQLSRMQRYAHSHIALMNFDTSGGHDSPERIRKAINGHFQGPLGLNPQGNVVEFADQKMAFTSVVTGRPMSVSDMEFLWQKYGCENSAGLGFKSEKILNQQSTELHSRKPETNFSPFTPKS